MRIPEYLCMFFSSILPKKKFDGREGGELSYPEAQFKWASKNFELHEKYIDLQGKDVLDAGCGPGGKTYFYSLRNCKSLTGIDIDEKRIALAKEFTQDKGANNINFMTGSLAELPFEDNSFDIIMMNDVVEHIDIKLLNSALAECKRVLKHGGKLCAEFPPWTSYDASHMLDYINIPWCQVFFSDKTLINVVKKIGVKENHIGTLNAIDHYLELNKITRKKFRKIINEIDYKIVLLEPRILFNIRFIAYIPLVNKYLTRRVVSVLSK